MFLKKALAKAGGSGAADDPVAAEIFAAQQKRAVSLDLSQRHLPGIPAVRGRSRCRQPSGRKQP